MKKKDFGCTPSLLKIDIRDDQQKSAQKILNVPIEELEVKPSEELEVGLAPQSS